MATTSSFLLWSSSSAAAASSSSSQQKGVDGEPQLPPENLPPAVESPPPRPRPKRSGKASVAKRPPQRGLGVAQLERLRLQERWKKMAEIAPATETPPSAIHFQIPVYDTRYAAPVAFTGPWGPSPAAPQPANRHVHRGYWPPAGAGIAGYGPAAPAVRSVLHDQYAMDRYRAAAAAGEPRFPVAGTPFSELPSNQRTAVMQCFSDQCEFCARKKRLFGDGLLCNATSGVDYFEMDLAAAMDGAVSQGSEGVGCVQRNAKSAWEREVKEFEFFPPSRSASNGGGDSELGNRTVGHAASSFSTAAPSTLDLSLKLSF